MNSKVILSLFFTLFVLFILSSCPVAPLSSENVLINEFELDPPGADNCTCVVEWVELYNPTSNNINIEGWTVTTSQGRNVTIPEGRVIAAQSFYVVSVPNWDDSEWLVNENEYIILTDAFGNKIDETPVKSDNYNDDRSWSRVPDGQDNWVFQTSTQGISNVNQPPEANFSFYPPNPTPGGNVQFNDSSQDVDGSIVKWLWKFGDGHISVEQNPNHSYADCGSYIVWLNVTDDDGATDKIWKNLAVKKATQLEIVLPTSIRVGQSFNITAILKDKLGNRLEGEKVNFYVDGEKIASKITNFAGVASVTYTPTKSGLVLVKVNYNGSSEYHGSITETSLTIQEEKFGWTPYVLGGTTVGVVLGSIILMVRYRMKKKSRESESLAASGSKASLA